MYAFYFFILIDYEIGEIPTEKTIPILLTDSLLLNFQGRVRTKTVKKSSRQIIEKYYSRLTLDFQTNKKICDEVAIIPTKRLRNKIAGFATVNIKSLLTSF